MSGSDLRNHHRRVDHGRNSTSRNLFAATSDSKNQSSHRAIRASCRMMFRACLTMSTLLSECSVDYWPQSLVISSFDSCFAKPFLKLL